MVNDTSTLNGSLQECIDRLETNLQAMGVSDAEFDVNTGILGLIDEIPNISPSVGGIELDTNITLDESNLETEVIDGVKVYKVYNNRRTTINAYINALYDDTTVDMKGVLQGATVSYDLSQIGGADSTAISDNDGKFSMVINPTSLQDDIHYNVYMSFDGTGTDYKSCDELFRFMIRHDYNILFSQAEYTTYDGSCTVTATLTEDGVAMPYVELQLVNGGITYATLTDGNGVATFNLESLQTGTETWTCTYGNATATCTVTYLSYLFYDACNSSSGLSNYGTPVGVGSTISTNYTSYNSTENAYDVRTNGDWGMIPITAMTGQDNYKISMLVKTKNSNGASRGGFGFLPSNNTNTFPCWKVEGNGVCNYTLKQGSSEPNTKVCDTPNAQRTWYKIELIKTGTSYTCNVYDSNDTLLGTHTTTVDLGSSVRCGLYRVGGSNYGVYVKEIKAEPI